jgi:hypothetical protein
MFSFPFNPPFSSDLPLRRRSALNSPWLLYKVLASLETTCWTVSSSYEFILKSLLLVVHLPRSRVLCIMMEDHGAEVTLVVSGDSGRTRLQSGHDTKGRGKLRSVDFSSLADDGDLVSMSVADLRKCCKELGLKPIWRKATLVARMKMKVEWSADPK